MWLFCILYKLEFGVELVNFLLIISLLENIDKDDVIWDSEDEMIDGGEEEFECEVFFL